MDAQPQFADLVRLFPDAAAFDAASIPPEELPQPYRGLLAHSHHMTVTVEEFYGDPVTVRVLDSRQYRDEYARMILLAIPNGTVVQFGIVRVNLLALSADVRAEIVAGRTPLGRVLISHGVLRRIRPTSFVRATSNAFLAKHLGDAPAYYGRVGVIFAGDLPAVEVLEILAPVSLHR